MRKLFGALLVLIFILPAFAAQNDKPLEKAVLAGGCFWCMQPPFEILKGVSKVVVGYASSEKDKLAVKDYSLAGSIEAIEVSYDPSVISFSQLLDVFWQQIDPTDEAGQFKDRGPRYASAIFYLNDEQKSIAEKSKAKLASSGKFNKPIATKILKLLTFTPADESQQDYFKKNSIKYNTYLKKSGRVEFLAGTWGKKQ